MQQRRSETSSELPGLPLSPKHRYSALTLCASLLLTLLSPSFPFPSFPSSLSFNLEQVITLSRLPPSPSPVALQEKGERKYPRSQPTLAEDTLDLRHCFLAVGLDGQQRIGLRKLGLVAPLHSAHGILQSSHVLIQVADLIILLHDLHVQDNKLLSRGVRLCALWLHMITEPSAC